jgi:DNA-binding winged helix-turn-helix (wHTH) protein/TolB-like protein
MDQRTNPRIYEFEGFRLDADEHELWRGSEQVALTHKAVELLTLLIERRGSTVTKEEILEKLWPDTYIDENNLAVTVSMLRKAFGERAFDRKFIETIPKRGYRFVAEVGEPNATGLLIEKHTVANITVKESARPRRHVVLLAALILILGVTMGYIALRPASSEPGRTAAVRTIAVLPFKDLSGKHDESVSIGLTDALITKLGGIQGLAVRPTGAVLSLTGTPQEIGEKLKVEFVLFGTVQRDAERIRVAVQLINVRDNDILWTSNFDDKFSDLFKIQDAFAAQIAQSLSVNISDDERSRLARRETENGEAYQLYIRGRYFWNKRTLESFKKSIELFEDARQKDPAFALAYVGLADSYQLLSEYGGMPASEAFEKARSASRKAIELDPGLGEAHASLAYTLAFYDWKWPEAEAAFKRAIELDPNYATARQWYGEYLLVQGRFDESLAEILKAQELDPLSLIINSDIAGHHYMTRQFDKAIAQSQKVVEMDPNFIFGWSFLWVSHEQLGMTNEAAQAVFRCNSIYTPTAIVDEQRAAYEKGGWPELWRLMYKQWTEPPMAALYGDYHRALAAVRTGDTEETFYWLEKSAAARQRWFVNLKYDPEWDAIRSDARFDELVRKANLEPL